MLATIHRLALEVMLLAHDVIAGFPRGHDKMAARLCRAASMLVLDIAEASDPRKGYLGAVVSTAECVSVLGACRRLGIVEARPHARGLAILGDIAGGLLELAAVRPAGHASSHPPAVPVRPTPPATGEPATPAAISPATVRPAGQRLAQVLDSPSPGPGHAAC